MESLSGQGRFEFADGALVGVNLAQIVRSVQTALNDEGAAGASRFNPVQLAAAVQTVLQGGELSDAFGEFQETDFTALTGTFDINDGVAENLDLAMLSPLLRVQGQGAIDLAEQRVDYRITPRLVESLAGQGGELDISGVPIPVRIQGGLSDISVSIDAQAVIQELVRGRALSGVIGEDAAQAVQDAQSVEDALLGLAVGELARRLGPNEAEDENGAQDRAGGQVEPAPEADPADLLLQGLLGAAQRRARDGEEESPAEEEEGEP